MIVEDEVNILKYMQRKLSKYDIFQVEAAFSSSEEALQAFEGINPEVVFLDIEMPKINGIDLARKIKSKKQEVYIIFTTAYSQYAVDAFGVEAVDYLMKPVSDEDILRVIKRINKLENLNNPKTEVISAKKSEEQWLPISCFGKFQVLDRDSQVVKWPTKKAEELFAYFVMHKGQYISKWKLLELFWGDMDEERGLNNLYNTIYRIKQTKKNLNYEMTIKKVNDGYILEAQGLISDFDRLNMWMSTNSRMEHIEELEKVFFEYTSPLLGNRDYSWSFSMEEQVSRLYDSLCSELLSYYREKDRFQEAEQVMHHYILQYIEDEAMIIKWLVMLNRWKGHEGKAEEFKKWINKKLQEEELPIID